MHSQGSRHHCKCAKGQRQLAVKWGEMCKEKHDYKSARSAGKFFLGRPGQGQKDKRSCGAERMLQQSGVVRDEQAHAADGELDVPQSSCCVQDPRIGQRQTRLGRED